MPQPKTIDLEICKQYFPTLAWGKVETYPSGAIVLGELQVGSEKGALIEVVLNGAVFFAEFSAVIPGQNPMSITGGSSSNLGQALHSLKAKITHFVEAAPLHTLTYPKQ